MHSGGLHSVSFLLFQFPKQGHGSWKHLPSLKIRCWSCFYYSDHKASILTNSKKSSLRFLQHVEIFSARWQQSAHASHAFLSVHGIWCKVQRVLCESFKKMAASPATEVSCASSPRDKKEPHIIKVFTSATETADYVTLRHIWSCWETYNCLHGFLAISIKMHLPKYINNQCQLPAM